MNIKPLFCALSLFTCAAYASDMTIIQEKIPSFTSFDSTFRQKFPLASNLRALFATPSDAADKKPLRTATLTVKLYGMTYENVNGGLKSTGRGLCQGSTQVNVYDLRTETEGDVHLVGMQCATKLTKAGPITLQIFGLVRILPQDHFGDTNGDRKSFVSLLAADVTPWYAVGNTSTDLVNARVQAQPELNLFNTAQNPQNGDEGVIAITEFADVAN